MSIMRCRCSRAMHSGEQDYFDFRIFSFHLPTYRLHRIITDSRWPPAAKEKYGHVQKRCTEMHTMTNTMMHSSKLFSVEKEMEAL